MNTAVSLNRSPFASPRPGAAADVQRLAQGFSPVEQRVLGTYSYWWWYSDH